MIFLKVVWTGHPNAAEMYIITSSTVLFQQKSGHVVNFWRHFKISEQRPGLHY